MRAPRLRRSYPAAATGRRRRGRRRGRGVGGANLAVEEMPPGDTAIVIHDAGACFMQGAPVANFLLSDGGCRRAFRSTAPRRQRQGVAVWDAGDRAGVPVELRRPLPRLGGVRRGRRRWRSSASPTWFHRLPRPRCRTLRRSATCSSTRRTPTTRPQRRVCPGAAAHRRRSPAAAVLVLRAQRLALVSCDRAPVATRGLTVDAALAHVTRAAVRA